MININTKHNEILIHIVTMREYIFKNIARYDRDMDKFYENNDIQPDIRDYFFFDANNKVISTGYVALSGFSKAYGSTRDIAYSELIILLGARN